MPNVRTLLVTVVLGGALFHAANAHAFWPVSKQLEDPEAANVAILNHVVEPKQLPVNERLKHIRLPRGFEIKVFAEDLINPRMIAVNDDGTVYVTRREVGDVLMLRDTTGDGQADVRQTVARRPMMHGITIHGDTLFLATDVDLYRTKIKEDGTLGRLEHLHDDLPDGGQHPNRTLKVGPDGKLYVSIGSSCNACDESNPEHATMLQMDLDGSNRIVFARGLRNTVGFDFEPDTGEMWGMDHGTDWLGDNEQHEELNHIVKGNNYGWPWVYDDSKFFPAQSPPGDITHAEWAARSVEPVGYYTPHAAPMQMTFYTGQQFPADYQGDAFVAMRGSWNRKPPSGYEVLRIRFDSGRPVAFEAFATGFLLRKGKDWGHQGRLAGLAQTPDGALLLTDDTNGIMYRISYTGKNKGRPQSGIPTNAWGADIRINDPTPPEPRGINAPTLALDQLGAGAGSEPLAVQSPAFEPGGTIPPLFSAEEGENISPPVAWEEGPEGTQSYVLLMEDPDAAENPPFVHWLIYNIPAAVTKLPKSVPGQEDVAELEDALQGQNDRGEIGYFGPKPPPEDGAHSYHFQVFALDTVLDIKFGATRDELLAAMEGHVLAGGELIGKYER